VTSREACDFYNSLDPVRWGRENPSNSSAIVRKWLEVVAIEPNHTVLELGCGWGARIDVAPRYVALDLSLPALASAPSPVPRIRADMERLPVRSGSIEFLFSIAAIEHVPNPERVLEEVERVLRPGGVALLAPAWHCRPWAAEGLEFRSYEELTFSQRLRKRLIPWRNAILWRALFEAPRRALRELRASRGKPIDFDYVRLTPNLTRYVGTDCDAFTSMDPQAAILYFATRGWTILSHSGRRQRLLARSEAVVVRKPR
jgi:SAM-dependent methyltransferase